MSKYSPELAIFWRYLYGGGAERAMLNLGRKLLEQGIKVDMVVAKEKGSFLE